MALLGRIAAGRGLEAVATDEAYSLAAELLASRSGKRRYLLRVVGQSMVGARIEDGDLLVVEEDESPPDGSIVVVLLREGEEVTVKRLYREGVRFETRGSSGRVRGDMVRPRCAGYRVWVYVWHPPGEEVGRWQTGVEQLPSMTSGLLSYLVLGCVSAAVGYYFARKRTEYEVRYRQRVEVSERRPGDGDAARGGVRGRFGVRAGARPSVELRSWR